MSQFRLNGNNTALKFEDVTKSLLDISSAIQSAHKNGMGDKDIDLIIPNARSLTRGLRSYGGQGYLAPGVDPNTVPPHLLPYVRGIDFDPQFGKLAPGTGPNTIPPQYLPYVRYIHRRNLEIENLKDQLEVTKIERDNFRDVSLGMLSGAAKIMTVEKKPS